nr:hypothetical protein [Tanacetum cinerariifolium]
MYKGMQDGLAAGIDHGKAERGLVDVDAYDTSAKDNYVSAVNALRAVDFPLLAHLASLLILWVADTEAQAKASSSSKITFEQETLETSPENPMT